MNIKEYKTFQDESRTKIMRVADGIDPKLLGLLTYEELFDDKYRDRNIQENYNNFVLPLIEEYRINCSMYMHNVLCSIINDAAQVLEKTGYISSTGEETYTFDSRVPSDYIPCVELEGLVEVVKELQYRYVFRPYWDRQDYSLFGNNETVLILSNNFVINFIDENRKKFNRSFGESNLDKMVRSVRLHDTMFDYEIHIPQLSPAADRSLTGLYEESVRRHLILQKLMKDGCTGKMYNSKIDKDGTVTLECYDD